MQNELLDPQNEVHHLAKVTPEELPGYAEWVAEWESQQDKDWALNITDELINKFINENIAEVELQ